MRRLTAATGHAALAVMAGPQARQPWDALSVSGRRAVPEALAIKVELLRTGSTGRGFDSEPGRITWR